MTDTRPVRYRRMTTGEVLAELRLFCRHHVDLSEEAVAERVQPCEALGPLVDATDDLDWRDLEHYFGLKLRAEWWAAWTPDHTVGELCENLATGTCVPVLEPATVLGTRCETAGAFLTLKRMLADNGADVSDLGPSSEVKPYLDARPDVFHRFRLATDGRVPPFERQMSWPCLVVLVFILTAVGAWWLEFQPGIAIAAVVGAAFGFIAFIYPPRYSPTDSAGRRLTTFRDLIHAGLGRPPRVKVSD